MRWRLPIFGKARDEPEPRVYCVPEGQRVYAVGDVHGRLDLLMRLIDKVKRDSRERGPAKTHIIMLGDLIDRGPQSAQVLEYLRSQRDDDPQFHFLCGNHEEAMLASMVPGTLPEDVGWLSFGGRETMFSYGARPEEIDAQQGASLSSMLRLMVPDAHVDFLESFSDRMIMGDYLFVHAGIRPGVAIDQQDPHDLRWIRNGFIEDMRDHGMMIVHGHTISAEADLLTNRIGIDTGAYRTGLLTALGLEGEARWLVQVQG